MTSALMDKPNSVHRVSPDPDKKGEALRQQRFRMLEDIAEELSGDIVFPTYFDAVLKLRDALRDNERSREKLIGLIRKEPLICARVVHEANSKTRSKKAASDDDGTLPQPLEPMLGSIETAIDALGLEATRNLCLSIATAQLVRCKELVVFHDISRVLWEHSLYSAAAAEVICRELSRVDPEEAFFAGLVHDLGAFYMLYRAAQYSELRARPDTVKHVVAQWHESIGDTLFGSLKLPAKVASAASHHDQPRTPLMHDPRNLSEIIYAANALAQAEFEWLDDHPVERVLGEQYQALKPEIRERYETLRAN